MVKKSLIMKMTFGKDLKEVRESDTAVIWRKSSKQMEQLVQNP